MTNDPLAADFRNFLFLIWQHLNLPEPTNAQYEIAGFMQHGYPDGYDPKIGRADIVRAFRGVGKSYIAAAYSLWCLYRDSKNEKILVVSASSVKAKEFVPQAKGILMTFDLLRFLRPKEDQRNSFDRFDVRQASLSQSPSLKAAGITGQITGSRATRIIADDIEIEGNARTEAARETLMRAVSEFEAIKVPANYERDELIRPAADVLFLGTPQTEESIYNRLVRERNYSSFCVPARYPKIDKLDVYKIQRDDAITSSARKTKATARGHKSTGISGWAGSYEGVIAYDIYHADGVDYVCVEQRTHPSDGFATVDVLYNGPLGVFKARSLREAS